MNFNGKNLLIIGGTGSFGNAVLKRFLETDIKGATDAIINITGGVNLTLFEAEQAAEVVRQASNNDINTIFGAVINENLNDEIIVTVIATGFENNNPEPEQGGSVRREELRNNSKNEETDDDDDDDFVIPTILRKRGF